MEWAVLSVVVFSFRLVAPSLEKKMLPEYRSKANLWIGIGLLLQFGSLLVIPEPINALGILAGFVMILIGCGNYAIAKGYSGLLGILGIGSILGLVILICLPDKNK